MRPAAVDAYSAPLSSPTRRAADRDDDDHEGRAKRPPSGAGCVEDEQQREPAQAHADELSDRAPTRARS